MAVSSHRNCKAILFFLVLLLFVSVLCGCDPFYGKRPTDYKNSKWVCDDPDIVFSIGENDKIYREINGAKTDYEFIMGMGTNFWIYDRKTGQNLLEGQSSYSAQKMSVIVSKDDLFDGKYEGRQIVFNRVE